MPQPNSTSSASSTTVPAPSPCRTGPWGARPKRGRSRLRNAPARGAQWQTADQQARPAPARRPPEATNPDAAPLAAGVAAAPCAMAAALPGPATAKARPCDQRLREATGRSRRRQDARQAFQSDWSPAESTRASSDKGRQAEQQPSRAARWPRRCRVHGGGHAFIVGKRSGTLTAPISGSARQRVDFLSHLRSGGGVRRSGTVLGVVVIDELDLAEVRHTRIDLGCLVLGNWNCLAAAPISWAPVSAPIRRTFGRVGVARALDDAHRADLGAGAIARGDGLHRKALHLLARAVVHEADGQGGLRRAPQP
jgi:hypothetical protein